VGAHRKTLKALVHQAAVTGDPALARKVKGQLGDRKAKQRIAAATAQLAHNTTTEDSMSTEYVKQAVRIYKEQGRDAFEAFLREVPNGQKQDVLDAVLVAAVTMAARASLGSKKDRKSIPAHKVFVEMYAGKRAGWLFAYHFASIARERIEAKCAEQATKLYHGVFHYAPQAVVFNAFTANGIDVVELSRKGRHGFVVHGARQLVAA
jgi:hypothetical protein